MKVLELFCGLGGWSKAFVEAGHDCTGIDIKKLGYPYKFINVYVIVLISQRHDIR